MLMYYQHEERIAFQSDFQTIKIVPVLHRNVLTFFGMRERHEYLAYKRIKDVFIALDNKGVLSSWNVTSGKPLMSNTISEPDCIKDYQIYAADYTDRTYKMGWYPTGTLLVDRS